MIPMQLQELLKNVVNFGKEHPYGEPETEETVDNITLEKCREYYKKFFAPNISYLAVVGDINEQKAKDLVTTYLGSWAKKDVPEFNYPLPEPPSETKVELVDRPNSVQSVVNVTYPVQLKPGDKDAIPAWTDEYNPGRRYFQIISGFKRKAFFYIWCEFKTNQR